MLHRGASVPQQSKMVLSRLKESRDNRALQDSQEVMSRHAFELCGCVLGASMADSRRVKVRAGDMQVVPCALKCVPAHSETATVIQTCAG